MKNRYNYLEIADAIYKKVDEHLTFFDLRNDSEKAWDLQVQANKCKFLRDYLQDKKILRKFEKWLLNELSITIDNFEKIMKTNNLLSKDFNEYLKKINTLSATIAYCAQFNLEDCEIFFNVYKRLLEKQGINLLKNI